MVLLGPGAVHDGRLRPEVDEELRAAGVNDPDPEPPYSLTVLTATACNLGCAYCFQNDASRVRRSGGGTFDDILANVAAAIEATDIRWNLRINVSSRNRAGLGQMVEQIAAAVDPGRCAVGFSLVHDAGVGFTGKLDPVDGLVTRSPRSICTTVTTGSPACAGHGASIDAPLHRSSTLDRLSTAPSTRPRCECSWCPARPRRICPARPSSPVMAVSACPCRRTTHR